MRDRLIELLKAMEKTPEITCPRSNTDEQCRGCRYDVGGDCDVAARRADYLLGNGVIVPPCKVGDTVCFFGGISNRLIKSATVEEIIVNSNGVSDLLVTTENGVTFENSVDTFYFNKEAAEAALKERERG